MAARDDLLRFFSSEAAVVIEALIDERVAAALESLDRSGKRWLNADEAGVYLGCSTRAVYSRVSSGRIPNEAVRHVGSRIVLDARALDKSLK